MSRSSKDAGYASLTAIVLCTAVSVLCAGAVSLATAHRKIERSRLERVQLEETMTSAVMEFSAEIAASEQQTELKGSKSIVANDRTYEIRLTGQAEHLKWPIKRVLDVKSANLAKVTKLNVDSIQQRWARGAPDDCIASLFSDIGQLKPEEDRPVVTSGATASGGKDGQVWRVRAVLGNRVEERLIRFLGDPQRTYALISVDRLSLGEMPECTDLIVQS